MKKIILIILIINQIYGNQEIDGYASKEACQDYLVKFINYGFDGNITIFQKRDKINGKCFISDDTYLLNNLKKQHQTIDEIGIVFGTEKIFDNIFMITSHIGGNSNILSFYKIHENGFLEEIKGGNFSSHYGQPAKYLDEFKGIIKIWNRYLIRKNNSCYEIREDIYEYTIKKTFFSKIIEGKVIEKKCKK